MEKNLEYYLNLPYTEIRQKINDESGEYYYSKILELPGCQTNADTIEELDKNIQEAKELWIEDALEDNEYIPEPVNDSYSGKFTLRLPKTLHENLIYLAKNEGVSLNQYILYKLSK